MILLAIPTLIRFDLLLLAVRSAQAGTVVPDQILILDNSHGLCPRIAGCTIQLGRRPQSVARAWNDAAIRDYDHLIIANDDITFAPETIERLLTVAESQPGAGIVSARAGERFCCFYLNRRAWLDVGPFDEAFDMAYFEDNDFARRLAVAGWALPVAPSAITHVRSATIRAMNAEQMKAKHRAYAQNEQRYRAIWGGPPGAEVYTMPHGPAAGGAEGD